MSAILWWITEMFSPIGLIIGGLMGSGAAISGLVMVYIFPPVDPTVYMAEYIANYLATQQTLGLLFGILLLVSGCMVIVGWIQGGLENPIA